MEMTEHSMRCKRTREAFAMKLGGGWCYCKSIEDCPIKLKKAPKKRPLTPQKRADEP